MSSEIKSSPLRQSSASKRCSTKRLSSSKVWNSINIESDRDTSEIIDLETCHDANWDFVVKPFVEQKEKELKTFFKTRQFLEVVDIIGKPPSIFKYMA